MTNFWAIHTNAKNTFYFSILVCIYICLKQKYCWTDNIKILPISMRIIINKFF